VTTSPPAVAGLEHLSVSRIALYLRCGKRFWFDYVLHEEWEDVPAALVVGGAVHEALAAHNQAILEGRTATPAELHALVHDAVRAETRTISCGKGEAPDALASHACRLVDAMVAATAIDDTSRILAVEEAFETELAPDLPPLRGVIDVVEARKGRSVIGEYKTSAHTYSDLRVQTDIQLSAYALAATRMVLPGVRSIEDVGLEFRVVTKTRTPVVDVRQTTRSMHDVERLRELAADVCRGVAAGSFPRRVDWHCQTCPFRRRCQP